MLKEAVAGKFEYTKLSPEEQQKRCILGRLAGTIADFKHPTRNGRLYTEELWDKVFSNPIMKEKLENRLVLGELGHPADREEIDMEKVAICLAEEPKKCSDGTVKGVFDILDTPNGRILKTLCDYGCNIGVSSRGTGDIVESWNGESTVDPETYECECWDAVLIPAVKAARPTYMTESLEGKNLKSVLRESLEKASPEDRKIMEESLKGLNINVEENQPNDIAAEDNGADVIKGLQESLKQNKVLQEQVKSLQEKLSVCYAKETKLVESVATYRGQVKKLESESTKVQAKMNSLNEQLAKQSSLNGVLERKVALLSKRYDSKVQDNQVLDESVQRKKNSVSRLNEQLKAERVKNEKAERELTTLRENLEEVRQDSVLIKRNYDKKLKQAESLIEHYRKVALSVSDRYIEAKAKTLGVTSGEIKSKLNEGYSLNDIDRVCDCLKDYQLRVDALPFSTGKKRNNVSIGIKESYEPISPKGRFDDDLDDQVLYLAKTKK